MANRCASLDPAWAQLPMPAPSPWPYAAWLSPAAAFENDALTSALRASLSGASSPTPSSSTTSSEILATPHDGIAAPGCRADPSPARGQTRPGATGRVSKRKPRASRRAQTTYISADPANFSRMVQEITGFPVPGADPAFAASSPPAPRPAALACVLPTLDTSAFLLDRAPPPPEREEDKTSRGAAATMAAAAAEAESSSLLLELEALVSAPAVVSAFPTLESWGMI